MLSFAYRLRKKNDIERALKKGKRFTSLFFRVYIIRNALTESRFSVVVPKKTAKEAHARNRLKRRVGEILRRNHPAIPKGFDMVIFVSSPALEKSSRTLTEQLSAIFRTPFSR